MQLSSNNIVTMINFIGLVVGISACIMLFALVRFDVSYDKFWNASSPIQRLETTLNIPGSGPLKSVKSPGPLLEYFENSYGDLIQFSARAFTSEPTLTIDNQVYNIEMSWVDPEFVDIFDLDVIEGDIAAALSDPYSIAISESQARRLFGSGSSAIGKTARLSIYDVRKDVIIGAVYQDIPNNSVLEFSSLATMVENEFRPYEWIVDDWLSLSVTTYYTVTDIASLEIIRLGLKDFVATSLPLDEFSAGDSEENTIGVELTSFNLADAFLQSKGQGEMKPVGSLYELTIYIAITLLILIIASVNFMNITFAETVRNVRGLAIRKVLGAETWRLVGLQYSKIAYFIIITFVCAVALAEALLPGLSKFYGKELSIGYTNPTFYFFVCGILATSALIGGAQAALVVARVRPAAILSETAIASFSVRSKSVALLLIFQFFVSVVLLICSGAVVLQSELLNRNDVGFNYENLVILDGLILSEFPEQGTLFIDEVVKLDNVSSATKSLDVPVNGSESTTFVSISNHGVTREFRIGLQTIGYDFFETYQIPVLHGRSYNRSRVSDGVPAPSEIPPDGRASGTVIVNSSAQSFLGFGDDGDIVGQILRVPVDSTTDQPAFADLTIIGVIPDLFFQSFKESPKPEIYVLQDAIAEFASVRFSGPADQVIPQVEAVWKKTLPDLPIRSRLLEDMIAVDLNAEASLARIMSVFAVISILECCLGILSFSIIMSQARTKESVIRRIFGAAKHHVLARLLLSISKPIAVSSCLGVPTAIWAMSIWLDGFPVRIGVSELVLLCVSSVVLILVLAWVITSISTLRMVSISPAQFLKGK